jgi:hypothetical protein
MTALRRRAASIGGVAAVLALAGCASLNDPTLTWDEPANYTATVEYKAYDEDAGTYRITVRNHEVVAFARDDHRGVLLDDELRVNSQDFTLRQIVGLYRASITDPNSQEVIYFDDAKVPTYVSIDWYPLQITDEQTWIISDVIVVNP